VFLPTEEACGLADIAGDPSTLDVGAVDSLIGELEHLASRRALPTDDAALLELPEKVDDGDFALLTYAQVLRAAHYARGAACHFGPCGEPPGCAGETTIGVRPRPKGGRPLAARNDAVDPELVNRPRAETCALSAALKQHVCNALAGFGSRNVVR